jgi:Fur family transcriptional regulator, peroxide stress response regulator
MIRQTKQRQAIMGILERATDHPTAAELYERVRRLLPTIGYATVYRNLRALVQEGLVREVQLGNAARYEWAIERHDHAVCRSCGKLVDVKAHLAAEELEEIARQTGFRITEHYTELYGLCSDCQ